MIRPSIRLQGLDQLTGDVQLSGRELLNAYRRAIAEIGRNVRDDVRAAAPVDTGDTKRSIKYKSGKGSRSKVRGIVFADTSGSRTGKGDAVLFLEYGTVHSQAQPFFTAIVRSWEPKAQQMMQEILDKKIQETLARRNT